MDEKSIFGELSTEEIQEIRDLKIPRFRFRVQFRLPVLGNTGKQSNLRYTGWHRAKMLRSRLGSSKENFSTFVLQKNFFVVPKRFKSEKQVFM